MPVKSRQQQKLMYAVLNDPAVAKKTGVPQRVAKEFVSADNCKITKYMDAVSRGDSEATKELYK